MPLKERPVEEVKALGCITERQLSSYVEELDARGFVTSTPTDSRTSAQSNL